MYIFLWLRVCTMMSPDLPLLSDQARRDSPVTPNRLIGCEPKSGLMSRRSGPFFLNQPISFLLWANPRCSGASAQPNRKALVPWMRSVSPRATADNGDDNTDVQMKNRVITCTWRETAVARDSRRTWRRPMNAHYHQCFFSPPLTIAQGRLAHTRLAAR